MPVPWIWSARSSSVRNVVRSSRISFMARSRTCARSRYRLCVISASPNRSAVTSLDTGACRACDRMLSAWSVVCGPARRNSCIIGACIFRSGTMRPTSSANRSGTTSLINIEKASSESFDRDCALAIPGPDGRSAIASGLIRNTLAASRAIAVVIPSAASDMFFSAASTRISSGENPSTSRNTRAAILISSPPASMIRFARSVRWCPSAIALDPSAYS